MTATAKSQAGKISRPAAQSHVGESIRLAAQGASSTAIESIYDAGDHVRRLLDIDGGGRNDAMDPTAIAEPML